MASRVPASIGDNVETRRFLDDLARSVDGLLNPTVTPVAPLDASYVTLGTNAALTAERVLTAGTGISVTDNGAGNTVVIASTITAGLTLLSSAAAGGSTYAVGGLGGYKILLIFFRGMSHNSASNESLRIALSGDNGSSFGSTFTISAVSFIAAASVYGWCMVDRCDKTNNQAVVTGAPQAGLGGEDTSNRGPINALQFSFSGGSIDAGSIDIYGLK